MKIKKIVEATKNQQDKKIVDFYVEKYFKSNPMNPQELHLWVKELGYDKEVSEKIEISIIRKSKQTNNKFVKK